MTKDALRLAKSLDALLDLAALLVIDVELLHADYARVLKQTSGEGVVFSLNAFVFLLAHHDV